MSWETQAWAGRQRPGRPADKLVLLALASCADANHLAHPSVGWLADFGDLDRKTVNTALRRLEEAGLIGWTGERCGRTAQVKIYRLEVLAVKAESAAATPAPARLDSDPDSAAQTGPKTEHYQKRNCSVFSGKQAQKRATEPFLEPIPPSPSNDGETPAAILKGSQGGDPARPHRLPDDWQVPPVEALPPLARQLVAQWPSGAYEAMAEAFRLHWASEHGTRARKANWTAALGKWLIKDHRDVMRDVARGVSFAAVARPAAKGEPIRAAIPDTPAKRREAGKSFALHSALAEALGDHRYSTWIAPCALLVGDDGVQVIAGSEFHRQQVETHFAAQIRSAVSELLRGGWVRFDVQRPAVASEGSKAHG